MNLGRGKVAPESKSPIRSIKGDVVELVGGAYWWLIRHLIIIMSAAAAAVFCCSRESSHHSHTTCQMIRNVAMAEGRGNLYCRSANTVLNHHNHFSLINSMEREQIIVALLLYFFTFGNEQNNMLDLRNTPFVLIIQVGERWLWKYCDTYVMHRLILNSSAFKFLFWFSLSQILSFRTIYYPYLSDGIFIRQFLDNLKFLCLNKL